MLPSVKFGKYDSMLDFALIRTASTVGEAPVKTNTVEVEGADGVLDLTEYFGELFYENRTLEFTFQCIEPISEFKRIYSEVKNAINGKKMKIILSEDSDFYYIGRVSVNEWASNGRIGELSISCDCEPYKYRKNVTTKTLTVNGSKKVLFQNLHKRVVPEFNFSVANMQIKFGTATYTASAGDWSDPRLIFLQGTNEVTFTGNGTVTVTYQERGL